ncbi:MAG TPA: tRNA uridine-5-carboxymethylaminomethyl(34) synthesis GTPase MnmE, partial [Usitatibacter sp.]|nr:tRNA uridine-5-carboxymethylaminomethyl(34) synthesis GTPase MnmE [Usitatibacter sp.]
LAALRSASEHLHTARESSAYELVAEEFRLAHDDLGSITGTIHADDLLGAIFSRFCIGK